ncbi:hypothetical protein N7532_009322 [Penicillium argentinense]|uniref:Uncharacterized protein n=1 Tax=Penicillium argentinense TaxID=1131581 RepID=A0A9W9EZ29_9EURO|nr:uncharacterized protein N7532_009322 [Penicillium argentinense]KAJ5090638.1 hypothetical protein N7532_009322 [Penicillium argentinense]
MANLMKKFKRKRRLSSELHSRWGDPAISYPNQGSWNQRHQPPALPPAPPLCHRRIRGANGSSPQHMDVQPNSNRGDSVIPKGYFDENIRHRAGKSRNQSPSPYHPNYNHNQSHTQDRQPSTSMQGLGIDGTRYTHERAISNNNSSSSSSSSNHNHDHHDAASDSSCGEDDEGRDTLGDPGKAEE